ncbi:MAG: type I-E CRISPR-associated protein Cas7/Cse4/CasC [Chromatiales bacterium]|nr:type I-E CRISPR-associated protein Cas7/Cse4/CasC [Chromatiales bacterium]
MTDPRFLQIHTLSPYTAVLLNRDDSGLAKRLPYGSALRTRVSSQCLKRHWRIAEDPHALHQIEGTTAALRSRELVTRKVIAPLRTRFPEAVVDAIEPELQKAVYGDKGTTKKGRQTLLLGQPEIEWLAKQARQLAEESGDDSEKAKKAAEMWRKAAQANLKAMRETAVLPAGLEAALFGRMVTSDPEANITAPVHVAHAFTVHGEEPEMDYFTAVDDLSDDEPGADTIQETELTSGLFYGYVVIDLPGLVSNLSGDAELAGHVLHNLIYLIAEVSPGAKLGSTAPYSRASFMLLEAGDRQPRSLAEAYRKACAPEVGAAVSALSAHLAALDEAYATGEMRRVMSLARAEVPGAERGSLADLAGWAETLPAATSTS